MGKILSLTAALIAVVAMTATADAKSKKKHMKAASSGMSQQQWGWNSNYYMFKGDRYDFSGTYGTAADKARAADRRIQGKN